MEEKVKEFRFYWQRHYAFVSMPLEEYEIITFIQRTSSIELAVDCAVDYLLSQGLAEVEE